MTLEYSNRTRNRKEKRVRWLKENGQNMSVEDVMTKWNIKRSTAERYLKEAEIPFDKKEKLKPLIFSYRGHNYTIVELSKRTALPEGTLRSVLATRKEEESIEEAVERAMKRKSGVKTSKIANEDVVYK